MQLLRAAVLVSLAALGTVVPSSVDAHMSLRSEAVKQRGCSAASTKACNSCYTSCKTLRDENCNLLIQIYKGSSCNVAHNNCNTKCMTGDYSDCC